jgi:hypothetical protein
MNSSQLNAHDNITHLDEMIELAPSPQEGINAHSDDFDASPPTVARDAKGNLVIMQGGKVIGTLQQAKKMSYAKGIEGKFQEKRRQAYLAKQAKQTQNVA